MNEDQFYKTKSLEFAYQIKRTASNRRRQQGIKEEYIRNIELSKVKSLKDLNLPFKWSFYRGKIPDRIRSSEQLSLKRLKRRFCTDHQDPIKQHFCAGEDTDKGVGSGGLGGGGGGGSGGAGAAAVSTTLLSNTPSTVLTENMHMTSKASLATRSTGHVSRKVVLVPEPSSGPTVSVLQSTFRPTKGLFSQQKTSTTTMPSSTKTLTARTSLKTAIYFLAVNSTSVTSSFISSTPVQIRSTRFRTTHTSKPINNDRQVSTSIIYQGLSSLPNFIAALSTLSQIASKLTKQITTNTSPVVGALPHEPIKFLTQSLSDHIPHISNRPRNETGLNRRTDSLSTVKLETTSTKPDMTIAGMKVSLITGSAVHIAGETTAKISLKAAYARDRFFESATNIAIICTIVTAVTMSAVFVFAWTLTSQCNAGGSLSSRYPNPLMPIGLFMPIKWMSPFGN